jgi:hypothetical protein
MATRLAHAKQRRRHAGTLAFFVLVLAADIGACVLAYLYGATIGAWLLKVALWAIVNPVASLHYDLTTVIFLLLLIPVGLAALVLFAGEGKDQLAGGLLLLILVGLWCLLHFGFHVQGISFVPNLDRFTFAVTDPQPYLAAPNMWTGLVWLAVHLLLHGGSDETEQQVPAPAKVPTTATSASGQDELFRNLARASFQAAQGLPPSGIVESTLAKAPAPEAKAEEQTVYLNPLEVGEDKWDVLVGCIAFYEEHLTRLSPPPVSRLKVPPRKRIYYVSQGNQVIWHGHQLVLTESLLDPAHENRLLTGLARALWDCNSPDLWTRLFLSMYPDAPGCVIPPASLLGLFIWLPSTVKWALRYQDWRADRELAKDRFAWMCGAGETLLHQIRQWIAAGLEEPDPHLPRLVERQGQLEALLKAEHRQMLAQDLTPAQPLFGQEAPSAPKLRAARHT